MGAIDRPNITVPDSSGLNSTWRRLRTYTKLGLSSCDSAAFSNWWRCSKYG
jgi:hypothetical protein